MRVTAHGLLLVAAILVAALGSAAGDGARAEPFAGAGARAGATASPGRPPYLLRGDEVEARYRSYRERLERFFEDFAVLIATDAPALHARLRAARPSEVPYGYGILPKVVPDP